MKNQSKIQQRYDNTHTKQYHLKFHLDNDKDIITWLDQQANKQGTIKQLIRAEIKRSGKNGI